MLVDEVFEFHPEDASTLGVESAYARLSDPRRTAEEHAALSRLTPPDDPLDGDAFERWRRYQLRYLERDGHATNLELLLLPAAAVHHARIHGRDPGPRRRALPDFLRAQRANLERGLREKRPFDAGVARVFAEHVLPGAAASTGEPLYSELAAFVANEIVPAAEPVVRLGEDEVRFRLREVMGIERSIDELLASAEAELAKLPTIAPDVALSLFSRKAASVEEAVAGYARHVEAATALARAFVTVPDDLALAFEPLPAGIADGTALTNWPAPLLDPNGRGHVLYAPDASAHAVVSLKNLAVHEAIPGHYLQSAIWQRAGLSALRFLGVADDVAMSRGYYGTMPSVEGWAVFMERTLFRRGFYDEGDETTFFAMCEAIRAMRVIVDLELHARNAPLDRLAERLSAATGLPAGWAEFQLIRARRMPLQPLTYLVGAQEIEALGMDADRFLSFGPVPPSRLAKRT